jgi:hypothetical protein
MDHLLNGQQQAGVQLKLFSLVFVTKRVHISQILFAGRPGVWRT